MAVFNIGEPPQRSNNANNKVLSGWKDIAAYLGRGVRTVQRWEKLGLPVRRPNAHLRSAVIATAEDIDVWIAHCTDGRSERGDGVETLPVCDYDQVRAEIEQLRHENERLRTDLQALKVRVQQTQAARTPPSTASSSHAA